MLQNGNDKVFLFKDKNIDIKKLISEIAKSFVWTNFKVSEIPKDLCDFQKSEIKKVAFCN